MWLGFRWKYFWSILTYVRNNGVQIRNETKSVSNYPVWRYLIFRYCRTKIRDIWIKRFIVFIHDRRIFRRKYALGSYLVFTISSRKWIESLFECLDLILRTKIENEHQIYIRCSVVWKPHHPKPDPFAFHNIVHH
jgi:hypothetical protein